MRVGVPLVPSEPTPNGCTCEVNSQTCPTHAGRVCYICSHSWHWFQCTAERVQSPMSKYRPGGRETTCHE